MLGTLAAPYRACIRSAHVLMAPPYRACIRSAHVLNRHRGGGHPPTPATPPCVRVRTRRFERVVNLTPLEQRRCRSGFRIQSSPGAILALFLSFLGLHPDP